MTQNQIILFLLKKTITLFIENLVNQIHILTNTKNKITFITSLSDLTYGININMMLVIYKNYLIIC